jgi:hypothetical protein
MKLIFALVFLLISSLSFAADLEESILTYTVDSIVKDPTLKSNESAFTFSFHNFSFDKNNRDVLYAYNGIEKIATLNTFNQFTLNLPSTSYKFDFFYSNVYYEIHTDSLKIKSQERMYVSVYWQRAERMIQVEKPVIYLYPETPTIVEVKVLPKGDLTFMYPAYNDGWKVSANPSGELEIGQNKYNYLFWESSQQIEDFMIDWGTGFIVEKENTIAFLEEKLNEFGLNDSEKADFITFWGPQLVKNPKNFIQFVLNDDCERFADLAISPKPDHLYRIYILTAPLAANEIMLIKEQQLAKINRSGFTVIEWGGSTISKPTKTVACYTEN